MTLQKSAVDRFWQRVQIGGSLSGCWTWTGAGKYGVINIRVGRNEYVKQLAHRFSWELHKGISLKEDEVLAHVCHNPKCVNPGHLRLEKSTNTQEMTFRTRESLRLHRSRQSDTDVRVFVEGGKGAVDVARIVTDALRDMDVEVVVRRDDSIANAD